MNAAAARDADRPAEHVPVMLAEVVGHLVGGGDERVLDCTLGLGGHSRALLDGGATVLGIDRDPDARNRSADFLGTYGERFAVRAGTFATVTSELVAAGEQFDGVLADLGVSSMQLDQMDRGFSFRSPADLDLRMGDGCSVDACGYLAATPVAELVEVIRLYGEEPLARRIAPALKDAVASGTRSASGLAEVIRAVVPGHRKRHPAVRTFQALRMAINAELDELRILLGNLPALLRDGGKAVIITFHSLEDRIVKRRFRAQHAEGRYRAVSRKVVKPGATELTANRRAHSAKLRWAQR